MQQLVGMRKDPLGQAAIAELGESVPTFFWQGNVLQVRLGADCYRLTTSDAWEYGEYSTHSPFLGIGDNNYLMFTKIERRAKFHVYQGGHHVMNIEVGPVALQILLQRITAIERDELPATSRAELQKFLQAAAQLLD